MMIYIYGILVVCILMVIIFIMVGFGKIVDVVGFVGYMVLGGILVFLVWLVILFEIFGGLVILIGY